MKAKQIVGILMVGVTSLVLAACGNGSKEGENSGAKPSEKTNLIVGLDDTFAPMGFRDDNGEIIGFDIDLAKEIESRTGLTFTYQPIDWALKETELSSGNIDLIWNGYTITDARKEKLLFSAPYMSNAQIVVVKEDSPIQNIADLSDKIVATQTASSSYEALEASGKASSFKNGEVISYASYNDVFNDLEAGRADAIVVDETLGRYYMQQKSATTLRVLKENFGQEEYGIGLRKADTDLKAKLDKALEEIKADGTYDKIHSKWFSNN